MEILLVLSIVLIIIALLWWLLVITEGVYLGRGVVIWLYDLYAKRYDNIKEFEPVEEAAYLSRPLIKAFANHPEPLILDVATGTGRLPMAFFAESHFKGQIVGIDLSRKMLAIAAQKLATPLATGRLQLLCTPAEKLPFPDETFDLVTCLEALEFMTSPQAVLAEMIRVARPGAIFLFTNRQDKERFLFPGKTMPHARFITMLEQEFGLLGIKMEPEWTDVYALIWAHKSGRSTQTGIKALIDFLQCPNCGKLELQHHNRRLLCGNCQTTIAIGADGIVEFHLADKKISRKN